MKPILLAFALALAAAPMAVAHAEGNGPAFPGLQNPNIGFGTAVGPNGTSGVTVRENSAAGEYAIGRGSWNTAPKAPAGLTPAQAAQRAHTWQMLDDNSGGAS